MVIMKKGVFIFILLFLLLFINTEARGIGMRSGSLTVSIDFVPNFQQTYYYSVIPYGDEPMDVGMYVENDNKDGTTSDLSKYFIIEPTIFKSVMPKQEPFFSVTVRLPGEIEEPGTHKLHVSAAEAFPDGGGVGIKAAVEAIFYIHVPYDGQYLTYSMETESVNQGTPIPIKLTLSNLGKEMINELYADIVLFDSQKNEADRIKTETIGLKSQENTILKNEIKTVGLSAGEYTVNATVHYDGKQVSKIQKIKVGELKLIILNQTQEITAGKVNEINVDIGSEWAETVKNVYAQVQIGDKQPVKTLSENLLGFQKTRLKAFFDAIDMKPGVYDMITKVYYEEKMTSKITMINVIKGVSSESAESNISFTNILLITVILVVVIINIVLFKILLKKKDENEKER